MFGLNRAEVIGHLGADIPSRLSARTADLVREARNYTVFYRMFLKVPGSSTKDFSTESKLCHHRVADARDARRCQAPGNRSLLGGWLRGQRSKTASLLDYHTLRPVRSTRPPNIYGSSGTPRLLDVDPQALDAAKHDTVPVPGLGRDADRREAI